MYFKLLLLSILIQLNSSEDDSTYFNNEPEVETALTEEDFERARYVPSSEVSSNKKAEQRNDLFEGDIVVKDLTKENMENLITDIATVDDVNGILRNAIKNRRQIWQNRKVPYSISSRYSSYSRSRIAAAMQEYATKTCVQFVPKTNADYNYLYIMPDDGCYSTVGKEGGRQRQVLSLGSGCVVKGIIIHELMHAIGFFHEQGRNDRDSYVDIKWNNIEPGMEDQFQKYSLNMIDHLGTSYDYGSIMHYEKDAFSKNDQPTIVPKQAGVEIGQRRGFSSTDRYKINKLYQCDGGVTITPKPTPPTAPPSGCSDKRSDCVYLQTQQWCTQAQQFMSQNCPKTCNFCSGTGGSCLDKRTDCSYLNSYGYCTLAQGFMRENCAKTCSFCSGPQPTPAPACQDKLTSNQCINYSRFLSCLSNQLLRQYCARTCNAC